MPRVGGRQPKLPPSGLSFVPPSVLEDPQSCFLEWQPYVKDRTMGLNHQAASLSCALGEAYFLGRTLLLPDAICLFALHTERWAGAGRTTGERCVPLGELWDVPLLSRLVPLRLVPHNASRPATSARTQLPTGSIARVGRDWKSARVREAYPCRPTEPSQQRVVLVRRNVESFWFQQCTRSITDYRALAGRINELLGAPASAPRPPNILLRSGLFFARHIKEAAAAVRARIGANYVSLHVRRSDKLTACSPEDCRNRDESTRPAALLRALDGWFPRGTHVYVGSTERPAFFAPLADKYRLHFAEDFADELNDARRGAVSNNYALYAFETLLFFGSRASVETYSYQTGWFIDACFPAAATRRAITAPPPVAAEVGGFGGGGGGGGGGGAAGAAGGGGGGVRVECRDKSGALVNGVLYGRACLENAPCGRGQHLVPRPRACGRRLTNSSGSLAAAARRAGSCAAPGAGAAPSAADASSEASAMEAIGRKRRKAGGKAGGGKAGGGKAGGGKAGGKPVDRAARRQQRVAELEAELAQLKQQQQQQQQQQPQSQQQQR